VVEAQKGPLLNNVGFSEVGANWQSRAVSRKRERTQSALRSLVISTSGERQENTSKRKERGNPFLKMGAF